MARRKRSVDEWHDTLKRDIGYLVRETRTHLGVTQRQLATESGVSYVTISTIENGKYSTTTLTTAKLYAALERLGA